MCKINRTLYEGVLRKNIEEDFYKEYCSKLKKQITDEKRKYNSERILGSTNKVKAAWELTK